MMGNLQMAANQQIPCYRSHDIMSHVIVSHGADSLLKKELHMVLQK